MDDFYCREVLSGALPVETVEETDRVLAFRHTRPHYREHVVVVPREHVTSLLDLSPGDGLMSELLVVVQQVAERMVSEQGGCHIVTNLGLYQEEKHLHIHVGAGEPV